MYLLITKICFYFTEVFTNLIFNLFMPFRSVSIVGVLMPSFPAVSLVSLLSAVLTSYIITAYLCEL